VVYVVPSTVKERPDGLGCTVNEMYTGLGVKLAVSKIGAFIVTDAELLFPEYEPDPLPVQLLKLYPLFAVALIGTTVPLLYHPPPELTLPPAPALTVRAYSVPKFAV
jgi:hypothetical protein